MARPRKHNADYFPHDAGMRNDDKIKAVRRKYGHEGYSVWNMILEKLCGSVDFNFKYNESVLEIMSGDFDVEPDKLKLIIEYFLKIELLILKEDLLFSRTMIDQFELLFSKRKRDRKEVSDTLTLFENIFGSDNDMSSGFQSAKVHKQ